MLSDVESVVSESTFPMNFSVLRNPYLLLTATALMWGGNAVAGKLAVDHVSPFLLTFLRWVFACLVILPFAIPHLKKDWPLIRQNLVYLFLLGASGFAIFNNLMYLALNHTSAINVAIEQASMPLIVFVLNYILYRTHVTAFQILGFLITLIGVAITATRGNLFDLAGQSLNFGDITMLFAIMVYGGYSVFLQRKPDIHLWSFICVLGFSALCTTVPFMMYEATNNQLLMPDMQGWGVVLYAAIFPSIVSQLFWVIGLSIIGSNRGGLFINLVPIFGAILAVIILGEKFQTYHAIGLVLVLGGITLAQRTASKKTV